MRAIGLDVCEIARLARALDGPAGTRFLARVFTDEEQAYCDGRGAARVASYAARFAAKEAVAKALGTGIGAALAWRDVEVLRALDAPPTLRLSPRAEALAAGRGIVRWHLALSHAGGVAVAMVVAEGRLSEASPADDVEAR